MFEEDEQSYIRFTGEEYLVVGFPSANIESPIKPKPRGSVPSNELFNGEDPFPPDPDLRSWIAIIQIFIPMMTHGALDRLHNGIDTYDLQEVELDDGSMIRPWNTNDLDESEVAEGRKIVVLHYKLRY